MHVKPNQIWVLGEAIVVVLCEKAYRNTVQMWWQLLDLETGNIFHLGEKAFGFDKRDVLLHEALVQSDSHIDTTVSLISM